MTLKTGTQLGPYEIIAPLGAGGMGEVYRAKDTRLDREVAVKVLPEHLARDPGTLKRFEREAKAVAALSHPNILAIFDIGTEGETSFVVTELLEGETLRERVRRSAIPWRKAVENGVAIAEGLAAAHGRGIIHRDLKPENIFMTSDGVVKILDFGLARMGAAVGGTSSEDQDDTPTMTLDTRPGTVLGTVNYMSPEQISGRTTDPRTDVFSFGCVLYEMVTGSRAFAGKSIAETTTAILRDEPSPLAESGQLVPPEVDRVITRCVEKKPEHRIQSARDLGFALRDILMDSGPSRSAREMTVSKAPRLSWLLVGALAVALAVILTLWQAGKPGSDKGEAITSLAVLPFASAGSDPDTEYLSDEIPASIINNLARLSDLRVVPRGTAFRHKGQEKELATLGRELKVEAILTGRVVVHADSLIIHAGLIDVANDKQLWGTKYRRTLADILAIEEDIAEHISDALRLRLTHEDKARLAERYTGNAEAHRAYLQGRFWWNKRTKEGFRKAIEFFDEAIRIDPTYALAYAGKADTYTIMGYYTHRPSEVAPLTRDAADTAIRLDPAVAEAYPPLGWVHAFYDWDWEAAERDFRKAIELNPRYATAHHWYAVLLLALGRFDEAEREISRARQLDPGSLIINREYASVAFFRRDFDLALQRCRRAVEMDPMFAPTHKILGDIYLSLKRYDEAIAEFRKLIELEGHAPRYAGALGYTYGLAGRRDDALEELRILTELSAQGEYVPAGAFGMIHAGLEDFDLAFERFDKACAERDNDVPFFKFAPGLDPLRCDPRFDALLKKMNLPPDPPAPVVAPRSTVTSAAGKTMLAVLPFEGPSTDTDTLYLKEEIPASIIHSLSNLSGLQVVPRSTAFRYQVRDQNTAAIGRDLGATAVLTGQVNAYGGALTIRAELVDVATKRQLWNERYDRRLADILTIEEDIARQISDALRLRLTHEDKARLTERYTENAEAYRAYLQGRFWWNRRSREGYSKAIELFDEAIGLDPDYALAYAGKADCYCLMVLLDSPPKECIPQAREAAEQALAANGTLAEAHTSLGWIKWVYDWDWPGAERSFKRAIELNPRYPTAYNWYAGFLAAMGRDTEAIEQITRAHQLDPGSLIINRDLGVIYSFTGQIEQAIEQLHKTIQMDPLFAPAHAHLGRVYVDAGMYAEAIAELETAVDLTGHVTHGGMLGHAYARVGRRDDAARELEILTEFSKRHDVPAFKFAVIHAGLDDKEQAFEWLEKAYENREFAMAILRVGQGFGSLRDDPRFDDLLRRVGLPPDDRFKPVVAPPKSGKIMLAVLPFEDMSPEPQEWFSDGMTEEMIAQLGRLKPERLSVIARTSAMRYKGADKTIGQIGRELGVQYLVEGSVRRSGERVRITARLTHAGNQTQLWVQQYDNRSVEDVFDIQAEVAGRIASLLAIELLPDETASLANAPKVDAEAHELYLKGRYFLWKFTPEGCWKALEYFEQAIEQDPSYALAHAGIARAYSLLAQPLGVLGHQEAMPKAKAAALKALKLDDTLAEAHDRLAWVRLLHDWDFPGAERGFKRAIELDSTQGHIGYAFYLTAMGRHEDAIAEAGRAQQHDPFSDPGGSIVAEQLCCARRYDEAIPQLQGVLELTPENRHAHRLLYWAYKEKGRYEEAITAQQKWMNLSSNEAAAMREAFAEGGLPGYHRWLLDREQRQHEESESTLRFAFPRVFWHASLGEREQAFACLEEAYAQRDGNLVFLNVYPDLDPLRNDPRFDDLLRRVGLEVPVPATSGSSSVTPKADTRLAVLPFERMSTDPDTDYLSEEIPASIIDSLSNLSKLRVIPRSTAFRCKIGDRDIASIGRDLNATAVLTGQINTRGDDLRIRAELVDVATNRQLWSERYDRKMTDILTIERDITDRLSGALKLRLTGEDRTQLAKRSTENAEAHRAYLEGRFWWNRRSRAGYNKAIRLFNEAIRLDPDYALAYAGKADCYCLMVLLDSSPRECIPKAREAAEQALAANGTLAEAHTSLAWIKWVYDWDWPGAERSFKRAIELNPRYPTAYNWYAVFLAAMGCSDEALEQIERAHQLDPGSLIINRDLGVIYSWTGRFDRAVDQLRRTVQMDPLFAPAHAHLGRIYTDEGMYDEGVAELEIAADLAGGVTHAGYLGQAYAKAGRTDDAMRQLEMLTEFSKQHDVPAFKFSLIHAGLGHKEQAFELLEKAYENREFPMAILNVAEVLKSLRDDPRFDDLLRRVGLEPPSIPVKGEGATTGPAGESSDRAVSDEESPR